MKYSSNLPILLDFGRSMWQLNCMLILTKIKCRKRIRKSGIFTHLILYRQNVVMKLLRPRFMFRRSFLNRLVDWLTYII